MSFVQTVVAVPGAGEPTPPWRLLHASATALANADVSGNRSVVVASPPLLLLAHWRVHLRPDIAGWGPWRLRLQLFAAATMLRPRMGWMRRSRRGCG